MKKLITVWALALAMTGAVAVDSTEQEKGFDPAKVLADCQRAVNLGGAPEAFYEYCAEMELDLQDDADANVEGQELADATNGWWRPIRRWYWNKSCSYGYGQYGYKKYGYGHHYGHYSKYGYGKYSHHGGYGHHGWGYHGKTHYGHYGYGWKGHYHYGHQYGGGYGPYRR